MKTKGIRAWVVIWNGRECRIDKPSGSFVCLLPWRYSPKRVRDILDGIYLSYVRNFQDLYWFAKLQTERHPMIAEIIPSTGIVATLSKNPGLNACLCTDVRVSQKKSTETVTWTEPTFYRRNSRYEIVEEMPGATHTYSFNFQKMKEVRSSLPKC